MTYGKQPYYPYLILKVRPLILLVLSLCLVGSWVWWRYGGSSGLETPPQRPIIDTQSKLDRRTTKSWATLQRVLAAAQRKLPDIDLRQRENQPFSQIDPSIDELQVMEILLEIETEFGVDITQVQINQKVGEDQRRDLREHLTLFQVAECVEETLLHQGP